MSHLGSFPLVRWPVLRAFSFEPCDSCAGCVGPNAIPAGRSLRRDGEPTGEDPALTTASRARGEAPLRRRRPRRRETTMAPPQAPPHWAVPPVYPSLDSPEFIAAFEALREKIRALGPLFDSYSVRRRADATVGTADVRAFEAVTERLNAV